MQSRWIPRAVHWATFTLNTAWFGDCVAQKRLCAVVTFGLPPEVCESFVSSLQQREVRAPEPLAKVLLPPDAVDEGLFRTPGSRVLDERARIRSDPFLPQGAGWWKEPGTPKLKFFSMDGPAPTPKYPPHDYLGYGGGLFVDKRWSEFPVRILDPLEVWKARGRTGAEWRTRVSQGELVEGLRNESIVKLQAPTADAKERPAA